MRRLRLFAMLLTSLLAVYPTVAQQPATCSDAGSFGSPLTFSYNGHAGYIASPLLLTDGRVMVQYTGAPTNGGLSGSPYQDWYALTPNNGNYTTGTWAPLASMNGLWSTPYAPYAYASAVLPDGHVIVQGGEWNNEIQNADTGMGAIFDPFGTPPLGSWRQLFPPTGWNNIGDAQSAVLSSGQYNGKYMVAACGSLYECSQSSQQAILTDEATETWQIVNRSSHDRNSEEGYVLLPNGKVLTVDLNFDTSNNPPPPYPYEVFNPATQSWVLNDGVPAALWGNVPGGGDTGPMMLLPDGTVLAMGTAQNGSGARSANTAIYNPASDTWASGPSFTSLTGGAPGCPQPSGTSCPVGPGDHSAVLLPDGNVFFIATTSYGFPTFYEYVPSSGSLCTVAAPPDLTGTSARPLRLLLLPTGQVLIAGDGGLFSGNTDYYIYTMGAQHPPINSSWRPSNISVNSINLGSSDNLLSGTLLNGMSQASMLGDDFQNATNYPLVQLSEPPPGTTTVFARTHDHSWMGVGNHGTVTTEFDIPCNLPLHAGSYNLTVIANGIPSYPATPITINDTGLCH